MGRKSEHTQHTKPCWIGGTGATSKTSQVRGWVMCHPTLGKKIAHHPQWVDLRENLQETMDFPMKIMGVSCNFSLKPTNWHPEKPFMSGIFQAGFHLDPRATQAHWAYSRLRYSSRFLIHFHRSLATNTGHLDSRQTLTINMLSYAACFHVSLFWRFNRADRNDIKCPTLDEPADQQIINLEKSLRLSFDLWTPPNDLRVSFKEVPTIPQNFESLEGQQSCLHLGDSVYLNSKI